MISTAYRNMPLSNAMDSQRTRLFSRMTHYAESGSHSVLVTKEAGLQGAYWLIVVRNGSEVVASDVHYAGPEFAQRRGDAMLTKATCL